MKNNVNNCADTESNHLEFTFDNLFNMYHRIDLITEGPYDYMNNSLVDVVCFYDYPTESDTRRDICHIASLWLKTFRSMRIITKSNVKCDNGAIIINQIDLGVDINNHNPFDIEWSLRNIDLDEFLYICDDYIPSLNSTKIIREFLYTRTTMLLHNAGDVAQYRSLKRLFSYGYAYMNIPTKILMHGPQYLYKINVIDAFKALRLNNHRFMGVRGNNDWSMLATVGALRTLYGDSRYHPHSYFHYMQLTSNINVPIGFDYYCLNDGPEDMTDFIVKSKIKQISYI
jgi:hypothetical protein